MTDTYLCRFGSLAPALTAIELSMYGVDSGIWDDTLDCIFYELDGVLVEPKTGLERARELAERAELTEGGGGREARKPDGSSAAPRYREQSPPSVSPVALPLFEEEAA